MTSPGNSMTSAVCDFCKGEPVGNATSWQDGRCRAPASCPRCGEVNFGMKALTLWQPWAWAIVAGHKRIENRSWRTHLRGPMLIHAGAHYDELGAEWMQDPQGGNVVVPPDLSQSAIIGQVNVVDVLEEECSPPGDPWAEDFAGFKWVLTNPVEFVEPVPCKGQRGFWTPQIGAAA